jgi:hypothetical protein
VEHGPVTRPARALLALGVLLAAGGCATRTIDVGYPAASTNRALLAGVAPRRIVVAPVGDRRAETSRIGVTPEGGKAIVTASPVAEIVRNALVAEVGTNGHEVVSGPGDVVLSAEVQEFSLDAIGRSASTQYIGRVAIALAVADGRTGQRLLTRRYVGIRRQTGEADAKSAWRDVMDVALARTMHDVATDPELALTISRTER